MRKQKINWYQNERKCVPNTSKVVERKKGLCGWRKQSFFNFELKLSFESVAVEMFCSAWISSSHGKVATVDINLCFHFFAVSNVSKKEKSRLYLNLV